MNQPRWRLMLDPAADGAWNMAVDEALLLEAEGGGGPTLRLYTWRPHTLSLGAHQRGGPKVDWARLERDGYGVVRRPTGGRAILHAEELTYSVTAPAPPGGTLVAYRWLAGGLKAGLAAVGIEVELEKTRRTKAVGLETRNPCFTAAGRYELVAGGRKVVGSAQRRRGGWLMQHGSILLGGEHLRLPWYLESPDPQAEEAALRWATVDCSALLGRTIDAAEMAPLFAEGFARSLGVVLEPRGLLPVEERRARGLRERFADPEWTSRGRQRSKDVPGQEDTLDS
jgi:lipoate-protein ligase A